MFNQAKAVVGANTAATPEKTNVQRINDKVSRQASSRVLTALAGKQKEPNRGQGAERNPTAPRGHITGPVREGADNMYSQLEEGAKNKISPHDAGEILDSHGGRNADFHALSSDHVEGLLSHAKRVGYHKSKYASGSRARMFHQFLKRHSSKVNEGIVETGVVFEGRESEYTANQHLSSSASKRKPGHYLMKHGKALHTEPHASSSAALSAYKKINNTAGISIHQVKENDDVVPGSVKTLAELRGSLLEGQVEHENYKDHTKNHYHAVLAGHGFVHQATEHKQNRLSGSNPKHDYTEHRYTHPSHGKSHVVVTQYHDPSVGHGGSSKPHHFIHRHEQSNGIMAPASGDNKEQLHRSLSREYGVPKGMKAPKVMSWEKHDPPKYKMHEDVLDELKKSTLGSYIKKASESGAEHMADVQHWVSQKNNKMADRSDNSYMKRRDGIAKAVGKLTKEAIHNPNSSGQGHDPEHTNHPLHATIVKHGYKYSHSTPIHRADGSSYIAHTYKHKHGEYDVSTHSDASHTGSQIWSTSNGPASSRYQHHQGMGVPELEAHLKSKGRRYGLKKEDAPAMSSGGAGDPGHVQNATDNYASQLARRKTAVKNILRRKKPVGESVLNGHVPPEVAGVKVGVVSPEELKKNKELAQLPKKVGPGGIDQ